MHTIREERAERMYRFADYASALSNAKFALLNAYTRPLENDEKKAVKRGLEICRFLETAAPLNKRDKLEPNEFDQFQMFIPVRDAWERNTTRMPIVFDAFENTLAGGGPQKTIEEVLQILADFVAGYTDAIFRFTDSAF